MTEELWASYEKCTSATRSCHQPPSTSFSPISATLRRLLLRRIIGDIVVAGFQDFLVFSSQETSNAHKNFRLLRKLTKCCFFLYIYMQFIYAISERTLVRRVYQLKVLVSTLGKDSKSFSNVTSVLSQSLKSKTFTCRFFAERM